MICIDYLSGKNATVNLNPIYSHLNVLDYNTSILSSRIDTITVSGGGFDYIQSFSDRSSLGLGYNISDNVDHVSLSDVLKFNFGPNCTFDSCTFNSISSLTLNDVVNECELNNIKNGKLYGDVISCTFNNDGMFNMTGQDNVISCSLNSCECINANCSNFWLNTLSGIKNWNVDCGSLYSGSFVNISKANINAFTACSFSADNISMINCDCGYMLNNSFNAMAVFNNTGNMSGCKFDGVNRFKLCGESISGCGISNCNDVELNYKNIYTNVFSNLNLINVTCINMSNCNWNDLKQVNVNAYSLRDLTIQSIYDAHITGSLISNMSVTKMYSNYDISAFSIDWLQINWDPWATSVSTIGTVNVKAGLFGGNIVGAEDVCVKCDNIKNIGVKNCVKATISAKTIAYGFWVKDVDDLDLWFNDINLPSADADIYGLSNIGTLHIHQHSSYNGSTWNYLNNRPMAAFSNGVKCLDFDFKVPTYLINNGATTWNGAGYGYPGYHISDIYVNGVPYTCYSH